MIFRILYTLAFYGCVILGSMLFFLISPFAYFFLRIRRQCPPERTIRDLAWTYGRLWVKLLSLFTSVSSKGFETPPPSPCIVTVNHQSFFDPYLLGFWPHGNMVFFVRNWPFKIPFYGMYMKKAGYINTEKLSADEILQASMEFLKQGATVIIFPEGTRSTSQELGRFRSGAFKLAVGANTPIVPLCISGTGSFLPKGKFWLHPGPITVCALPPCYPATCLQSPRPDADLRQIVKNNLQITLASL